MIRAHYQLTSLSLYQHKRGIIITFNFTVYTKHYQLSTLLSIHQHKKGTIITINFTINMLHADFQLSTINYQLYYRQKRTYHYLTLLSKRKTFTINYPLSTIHYQPPTINYPLHYPSIHTKQPPPSTQYKGNHQNTSHVELPGEGKYCILNWRWGQGGTQVREGKGGEIGIKGGHVRVERGVGGSIACDQVY